ncbi:bacteriohemerythrin [Pseudodesulfovibrio sediminis]|uniref:Hemerythrin-like domain-containing protein n=1 Tax=Pseudodesulfovibrio sediminis TaxID=2810563 RepID=A0ABN6EXA6_9BACT|nr:hemerythrin family protein [Pseudodesulfovibrio sediminis]BCS90062.1 hypothetical protein PSDVSF_33040 [Pseudodesulfovibrio sediminis]
MSSKLNLAEYTKEYVIGIEELDEQHQSFFEMLTKIDAVAPDLYRPMDEDEADDILDILGELRDYALHHFGTEEGYMQEVKYPGLKAQKAAHNKFITDVIRMEAEIMNGSSMPPIKIRNFITEWYGEHILTMDKPFGTFYSKTED